MPKSHLRGHKVEFDGKQWVYSDTKEPTLFNLRNCKRCGKPATKEGYDVCLGKIEGATSACCGHGVDEGYTLY